MGAPQLVASKLIRYEEIDQADIRYLWTQSRIAFQAVEAAVRELPPPFDTDHVGSRKPRQSQDRPEAMGARMTIKTRAQLQACYELAFHPPRLNELWNRIKRGEVSDLEDVGEMLDTALILHQALPDDPRVSQRALMRLAIYQVKSRAFGTPTFLKNLRKHLGRKPIPPTTVPTHLIRDIGLPPICHHPLDDS